MAYPTILTQLCRYLFPLQSTHVRLVLLLPAYLHFYMLAGKRKSESKRENKNVNEDQVKKRNTESHALEVTLDVLISLTEVSKAPLLKGRRNERFKSDKHSGQCWNNVYGCSVNHASHTTMLLITNHSLERMSVTWINHQNQQNILVSGADIPEKTRNMHEDLMQDAQEQAVSGAKWDSWPLSVTHSTSRMAGTAAAVNAANAKEFHIFFKAIILELKTQWNRQSTLIKLVYSGRVNSLFHMSWRYMEEYLHSFLTLTLDECEWSSSCHGCSTPKEKAPSTQWRGGLLGSRAGLDSLEKRKISWLCQKLKHNFSVIQHVA